MQLDRRTFLGSCLSGSTAAALFGLVPGRALAGARRAGSARKTFVLVFLRGGMDGLNLVVPHGEQRYYEQRSSIAIPRPGGADGALDLDGFFGLHPSAAPLLPLFRSGSAVAVHAVGRSGNTRSHFEEQDLWETCVEGNGPHTGGWMNRQLATTEGHGAVRAIAMGDSLPRVLRGDASAIALRSLSDLASPQAAERLAAYEAALRAAHAEVDEAVGAQAELAKSGRAALEAMKELARVSKVETTAGVEYPQGALGRRFREVAQLVRADVGVELVEIDYGGFDTHQGQGGVRGQFANRVAELSGSLAAFCQDLGDALEDVMVLVVSEFGRTAAQNGTGGTDHGWGNCALALGGPVAAKSAGSARGVLGEWPGLAREQLWQERDLAHTTDFRDLFAEVVTGHLGNPALDVVLPGHVARPVGLI